MSSHREAPGISKDPVADNTDLYAFVSPDKPDTVTIIANYIPLEDPPAARTSSSSATTCCTRSTSTTTATATPTSPTSSGSRPTCATPRRSSTTPARSRRSTAPTGTAASPTPSPKWAAAARPTMLGEGPAVPAVQHRPALHARTTRRWRTGRGAHAGQRREGLRRPARRRLLRRPRLDLRPGRPAPVPEPAPDPHAPRAPGVERAPRLQRAHDRDPGAEEAADPRRHGSPPTRRTRTPSSACGPPPAAARRRMRDDDGTDVESGPFVQVSRLGNPLFNEVIVPMGQKDYWNALPPLGDKQFLSTSQHPELAEAAAGPVPGRVPEPRRAQGGAGGPGGDPAHRHPRRHHPRVPELHRAARRPTCCGSTWRSRRRSKPNIFGILGGDLAGFPNGRRVVDDVVTIELRAIAGVTYPLVDPSYTPDGAAGVRHRRHDARRDPITFLSHFPYLGVPTERVRRCATQVGVRERRSPRDPRRDRGCGDRRRRSGWAPSWCTRRPSSSDSRSS